MVPVDSCNFFRFLSSTICAKRPFAVVVWVSSAFNASVVAPNATQGANSANSKNERIKIYLFEVASHCTRVACAQLDSESG